MNINNEFWDNLDDVVHKHNEHILSDEQRKFIANEEQKAYEANIESIREVIEEVENKLKERGFWTETTIDQKDFRFRFNKSGYYGPGGFSSQYHMGGPLVLGVINPTGDAFASYYKNNLEENVQIGCNFDKSEFTEFVKKTIMNFTSANNLIISKEEYDKIRNFKANS